MNPPSRPAAWMDCHYLDDSAVLFCGADRSLYALNPTGAVIWTLLEEGHDETAAALELASIAGIEASRAARFVADALAQWRQRGFLADCAPPSPPRVVAPPREQLPRELPAFVARAVRSYRLLATSFTVRYQRAEDAAFVDPVLAHLVADAQQSASHIDVAHSASGLAVYQDGVACDFCAAQEELAPVVKSLVWLTAVNRADHLLNIHAGVVGDERGCVLLPAAAGSGKSTLCALMMARGHRVLSDEAALLQRGTLDVLPVPLALAIKDTGVAAVAKDLPEVRHLAIHQRHDGKRVAYLPPRNPIADSALPVHSIVFPKYTPGMATRLAPIPRALGLARLLDDCVAIPTPLSANDIGALVGWMRNIACFEMPFGQGHEAAANLVAMLAEASDRAQR
ncbi:MAG: PqqD family peptide modification chaperone [Burkholderiales bacterium]